MNKFNSWVAEDVPTVRVFFVSGCAPWRLSEAYEKGTAASTTKTMARMCWSDSNAGLWGADGSTDLLSVPAACEAI